MSYRSNYMRVPLILLGIILAFLIAGRSAYALDPVTYIDETNQKVTIENYESLDDLADTDGVNMYRDDNSAHRSWYILRKDKTFENRLAAYGRVYLVLCDGVTLNCKKGINVPDGSSLTIYTQSRGGNQGKIIADARSVDYCAGIGGNDEQAAGEIVITGGDIKAYAGRQAAGIGGGDKGDAYKIDIYNGRVEAFTGDVEHHSLFATTYSGAGIGGGRRGHAGEIRIFSGEVYAHGGYRGPGIGNGGDASRSGKVWDGKCRGGKVSIMGGKVDATAVGNYKDGGAGIGSGVDSYGVEVEILGGYVRAQGSFYDTDKNERLDRWGIKPGSCIGNGYSSDSPGSVTIKADSKNKPVVFCDSTEIYNTRIFPRAIGASHNSDESWDSRFDHSHDVDECEVHLDYPEASVNAVNKFIAKKDEREAAIQEQNSVLVEPCKHDRAMYGATEAEHQVTCEECATYDDKWHPHVYSDKLLYDDASHWKICTDCKYEDKQHKEAHVFNAEGKCECGYQGTKITYVPGNSASGDEHIDWASKNCDYTLPKFSESGFTAPPATKFVGWRVNGAETLNKEGEAVKIVGATEIAPIYEGTWSEFKKAVESADNGTVIKLMENTVAEAGDTAIEIAKGKEVTIDLNGSKLNRTPAYKSGETVEFNDDVIEVKGVLTIIDSSEGQKGAITGGNSKNNYGGGVTVDGGTLNLESGRIEENRAAAGGGVYVRNGGAFSMSGGVISGNYAETAGSGVYVEDGLFSITGGKVESNVMNIYTMVEGNLPKVGGVETGANGEIVVSGNPQIINNRTVNPAGDFWDMFKASNVLLRDGETIKVDGALDAEAMIGVSLTNDPDENGIVVTDGLSGNGTLDNIHSDEADFVTDVSADGEALLKATADLVKYGITIKDAAGGKAYADKSEARMQGTVALHAVPDEGYVFEKWEVEATSEAPEGEKLYKAGAFPPTTAESTLIMGNTDVTVTPVFILNPVEDIAIFVNDGTTKTPIGPQLDINMGDEVQLSAEIYPEGVTADISWTIEDPDIVQISEDGKLKALKPGLAQIDVKAGATTKSYMVIVAAAHVVNLDYGDIDGPDVEVYVASGGKVTKPEDPVVEGHKFLGWHKVVVDEATGEESVEAKEYNFDETVTSDFTLRAEWQHVLTKTETKMPTCTEAGNIAYYTCEGCGKIFANAEGTQEFAENAWVIQPMHHLGKYTDGHNDKTHYRICSVCNEMVIEDHVWDDGEIVKAPSSSAAGEVVFTCGQCGATKTEAIDKLEDGEYGISIYKKDNDGNDSSGGSVYCWPRKGRKGHGVDIHADEHEGYTFLRWIITGGRVDNPYSRHARMVFADSDVELTAVFAEGKLNSLYGANVELSQTDFKYNKKVQKPEIVTIGGYTLTEGKDYTVEWQNEASKNAGTYTLTVIGMGDYVGAAEGQYTIAKAANTMKASGRTISVKRKTLNSKKKVTFKRAKAIKVSKSVGKLRYKKVLVTNKKVNKKCGKYFAVNAKTGKVTVKKGVKKGTYKLKVKVTAYGNTNYSKLSRNVVIKVKVK